jgi:hypothetical protein
VSQNSRAISINFVAAAAIIVSISFGLIGCSEPAIEAGSDSDSTLVAVVSDLYLEEARYQIRSAEAAASSEAEIAAESAASTTANELSVESPGASLRIADRDSILSLHGLSESEFIKMMQPYLDVPDQLQAFYDRVLDNLSEERQKLRQP